MTRSSQADPANNHLHGRPLIIVTGFTAFLDVADNPSARLVTELAVEGLGAGLRGEFVHMETSYRHVSERIPELLARRPSVLLLTGYHHGATELHLERRATSMRSSQHADAAGIVPPESDSAVRVLDNRTIDFAAVLGRLSQYGVPARPSDDAGSYVCNHSYYEALRIIGRDNLSTRAMFLHIPGPVKGDGVAGMSLGQIADGVRLIVRQLAA